VSWLALAPVQLPELVQLLFPGLPWRPLQQDPQPARRQLTLA
jgi:hypothetical protein